MASEYWNSYNLHHDKRAPNMPDVIARLIAHNGLLCDDNAVFTCRGCTKLSTVT